MTDGVTGDRQKIPVPQCEQGHTGKELNRFPNNNNILHKLDPYSLNGIFHAQLTFKF
jgi:hypothetical protein